MAHSSDWSEQSLEERSGDLPQGWDLQIVGGVPRDRYRAAGAESRGRSKLWPLCFLQREIQCWL